MRKLRINTVVLAVTIIVMVLSVWGPEALAEYQDRKILNQIKVEASETGSEGYRYSLNSNQKLYILSKCLDNQILPESEQSSMTKSGLTEMDYQDLTGTYAFVASRENLFQKDISDEEVVAICNQELEKLKELKILPDTIKLVDSESYNIGLYSAIDVLEPRNNVLVWKISLSTNQKNVDKTHRLIDAYIDADTGKVYEFYVRTPMDWEEISSDKIIENWSNYLGLYGWKPYDLVNPLVETTPYFQKYSFEGMEDGNTVVTVGFYEGIHELFLKISK